MRAEGAAGNGQVPSNPGMPSDGREQDVGVRVLIANEPGMYREVISSTLKELRPSVEIFTAEPCDLEEEFLRLLPHLVVCSQTPKLVEISAPVWVELYPNGAPHAVVKDVDGSRITLSRIDFDTLLSIVDSIQGQNPNSRANSDGASAG